MSLIALVLMTIAGGLTTETRADNRLYIEPVVGKVGGTVNIPVYLDNSDDIVAAQFDVTLPFNIPSDGVVTMSNRSNGHAVSSSVNGKTITVMLTSMENKKLKGNSGILLRIPMSPYDDGNTATPYPIKISNIVLANNAGKNVATETSSESTFTVSTEDLPDLVVENIYTSPTATAVTPGEKATFNYTVKNQGDGATKAGWTAKLYMENETTGVRTYIGTQSDSGTLAGGASKEMTYTTILPSAMHIDGECKTYVEITPASGCGELIAYQGNNSGYSEGTTIVNKLLYLSSNDTNVYEGRTYGYARLTLTRSGDWSVSESYTVSSSVANLFCTGSGNYNVLPATVTIPKGAASVSFRIYSVDDNIVRAKEGDITVNAAHGYEGKTIHLNRIDNDSNPLTIALSQTEITEGGSVILTATRGGELTDELTLNVACSDVARFDAISAITFAQGESTKTIYISSIDDDAVQLDKSVRFSVSATDYQSASAYLKLIDNDRPTLKLTLSPSVISENAGNAATTAWISRSGGNNANPLKVRIRTSRSEVFAGSTLVEIPAGESGVEVTLGVTDNSSVDGTRTCNVIAEAFIEADNQYAPSSDKAYSTASLTVVDDESPYLALTSRSASIAEGGSVTVTVTRYVASASGDLVVNLSSAASDVTVPASVTIPSGRTYTTFTVSAAKNTTEGDERYVTITANGTNIAQGQITLRVTDRTLPDATIASVGHEGELYSGIEASFNAVVQNVGTSALPADCKIDFYFATSSSLGRYVTSTPLYSTTVGRELAAGDETTVSFTAAVPNIVGTRYLYAVVNSDNAINEFSTGNNTVKVFEQVYIAAPFAVKEIRTDKEDYLPGEYVQVVGKMEGKLNGQTVRVRMTPANTSSGGQNSYTDTQIDAAGNFSASVLVDRSAYGEMKVEATAIGQTEPAKTVQVNVYNMSIRDLSSTTLTCDVDYTKTGTLRIYNLSGKPLSGITLSNTTLPYGCGLTLGTVPSTIAARSYVDVSYTINPTVAMATTSYESFTVKAACAEGVSVGLPYRYLCRATSANISINPSPLTTTVLINSSRTVDVKITNYGLKESGKMSINIPSDVKWLTSLAPEELPSLQPGESNTIRLQLTCQSDMHSGRTYTSQINVTSENGVARTAKVNVTVTGDEYSDLTVTAKDVYALANNDFSKVAGAIVKVKNTRTGKVVFTGMMNQNGSWTCERMTEGSYEVSVQGLRHVAVAKTVNVGPGENKSLSFTLPYRAVLANFVTTQNLEDNTYTMVSIVDIDKNAPQAIVIPTFEDNAFEDISGTTNIVLTNVGSYTAVAPILYFPSNLEGVSINATNGYPAMLNPGESYVLNVEYTCPENMKRRIIASMKMTYGFNVAGQLLYESDIWQHLVGKVAVQPENPEMPEPSPIIPDPEKGDGAEDGGDEYESENLAEGDDTKEAGSYLPTVGGYFTLTFEDVSKIKAGQPVNATLKITNNSDRDMTKVRFIHNAWDKETEEQDLTDKVTFTSDGTTTVAAKSEKEIKLQFTPEETIAANGAIDILLGGQLAYFWGGIQSTAMMPYLSLTVNPVGKVALTYLVQRDFIGANRPAELVMKVRNIGSAKVDTVTVMNSDFSLLSNTDGKAVAYNLLYSDRDSEAGFHDFTAAATSGIEPEASSIFHWMYNSKDSAHVADISKIAESTNVSYDGGDMEVSIDGIYELVRSVRSTHDATVSDSEDEGENAANIEYTIAALAQGNCYLVNTDDDEERLPDAIITAGSNELTPVENVSEECSVSGSSGTYTLTLKAKNAGWVYGEITDPTNGVMMLTKVVRKSDGATVSAANFWQTDCTVGIDYSMLNENLLHFADNISGTSETYTLTFEARPGDKLKVTAFHLLDAEGNELKADASIEKPVKKVRVEFNKTIRYLYLQYISLAIDGDVQSLGDGNEVITRTSYQDFTVSLENVTATPGKHTFTVQLDKLKEKVSKANGEGSDSIVWNEEFAIKGKLDIAVAPEHIYGTIDKESGEYDHGALKLTAKANSGYRFAYWTVNGERVEDNTILEDNGKVLNYTVAGDAAIRAYFTPVTHKVTVKNPENGMIAGSAEGTYNSNETVRWVAIPSNGYIIDRWTINGTDYSESNDVLNYTLTDEVDDVEVEVIFKPLNQEFTLNESEGWNWSSHIFGIAIKADNFTLPDNIIRILSQIEEMYRDPIIGWTGKISDISAAQSLKVFTDGSADITLTGDIFNPKHDAIVLNKGWNWIGYPLDKEMTLDDALANLKAEEGDIISNLANGFSTYTNGAWNGDISTMVPGQGYQYKSASDKSFYYNNVRLCESKPAASKAIEPNYTPWEVDVHAHPSLMCIVAEVYDGNAPAIDGAYTVGAFVGEECRGIGKYVNGKIFLTVHGGNVASEQVRFVAIENASGKFIDIKEQTEFKSDALGTAKSPFRMTFATPTAINGISDGSASSSEVYNLGGQKVKEADGNGVYIIGEKKIMKNNK